LELADEVSELAHVERPALEQQGGHQARQGLEHAARQMLPQQQDVLTPLA
jgi:hypothetical protein